MRLSVSTKIFLGFVVVLLAYGGATAYGAFAVHALGQQVRLVALGYSTLRLDLNDLQTLQAYLQKRLLDQKANPSYFGADRNLRRERLRVTLRRLQDLRRSGDAADARFLDDVAGRLQEVGRLYEQCDGLYGRLFDAAPGRGSDPAARADLSVREEDAAHRLQQLAFDLNNKLVELVDAAGRYETRAALLTVAGAVGATGLGVLVMLLVQATLRPLRRLAEGAKEVARGNYQQRVAADTPDEVGALGREFNAMAAALQEREQRLRRSEQLAAVGKIAAQIAHEVRNPLSSISLNADMLADELREAGGAAEEAKELAQAIGREVDRLAQITEQYLRFSRLPDAHLELRDVAEVLQRLLQFQQEELAGRGIRLELQLEPGLPRLRIDENQLRQVLLNLVRNAAEAMAPLPPAERRLRVAASRGAPDGAGAATAVRVEVQDWGPGIPEALRAQIFEPFFTTKKGGTGLGLALVQEVVQQHGGRLSVTCPPGAGTIFGLEFPVPPPAGPPP